MDQWDNGKEEVSYFMTTKVDAETIDRKSNNLVVMAAYFA